MSINNARNQVYLTKAEWETLISSGSVTLASGTTVTYSPNDTYYIPEEIATTTNAGLMSSADKTKLDGLAQVATSGSYNDLTNQPTIPDISGLATTTSVNNKTYLKSDTDARATATVPNDYNSKLNVAGLKQNTTLGISNEGYYSGVVGIRCWTDKSGGNAHEFALTGNGNVYHRNGSTTTWSAWEKMAMTSDLGTQVTYSYASGVLTITTK